MNIPKVVFLDIDGVLNISALNHSKELFNEMNDIQATRGGRMSSSRIENLNHITDSTGAKIVISSTWRHDPNITEVFEKVGITGEVIGITPNLRQYPGTLRGNEIYKWMKDNIPYKEEDNFRYVILDDDSDMLYWQRNHLLLCDRECGLSQDIAYKAIRILNGVF